MKILSLGLDNSILDENSSLAKRAVEYGDLVEKYTVIVPSGHDQKIELSGRVKVFGLAGKNKFFKLIRIHCLAEKLIREEKYDVITVQDAYFLALAAWRLAKRFGLGFEIQIHGWEKFGGGRKIIAEYLLPRAAAVRTVSQRLKKQLIEEFKVAEKKITVAPIYKDIEKGNYETRNKESGNKEFIFLTVGRLAPIKNIKMQIEALADVVKIHPETKLWIVGDGPEKKKLEFKIKDLGLEQKVKFWGWQNDPKNFYRQADVFILTSDYEGWGLAIVEAAGFSLPIIMTDVGCAGELIRDKESGLIVPVGNQKMVRQAMVELVENDELRKKIGEGARQALLKLPTKEQTLALYKESWGKALIL